MSATKLTDMGGDKHRALSYPGWMVMGAAVFGVLLGGTAFFFGIPRPTQTPVLEQIVPPTVPAESSESPNVAPPRVHSLADAVARTRGTVVCLKNGDQLQGAGVVYDDQGTVLTNYHVVEAALRPLPFSRERDMRPPLTVRFANGRELPAKVVITSPEEDIAMLRLQPADSAEKFESSATGRSGDLVVGQTVFAVGCPLGLAHTVSSGIVSAVERTEVLPNPRLPVLQLDASINLGNSGGPLFNLAGEIVGITTARSRKGEGIGFAIPIDRVLALLRAVERGESSRAAEIKLYLDAKLDPRDDIAELGYSTGTVVRPIEGGPAHRAGVRSGDVLVEMEGARFDDLGADRDGRWAIGDRVISRVRSLIPGEALAFVLVRDGNKITVTIKAEAVSEKRQVLLEVEDLFGLSLYSDTDPPTVERVVSGSAVSRLRRANALKGYQLTHVLGQPVPTVESLGAVVGELQRQLAAGRRGLTVAVDFRDKQGKPWHVHTFPLTLRRGSSPG